MGKYCIVLTFGGVSMIVSGVIAGISLYVSGKINDTIGWVILFLIIGGIILSYIGFSLLDWRKIFEGKNKE